MSGVFKSIAFAALLGACWFSFVVKANRWEEARGVGTLETGIQAPVLNLSNLEGDTVEFGRPTASRQLVVVVFWATWCGPCRIELAELARLYEEHASRGLEVLAVSIDRDPEAVRRYVEDAELPFPVLLDPGREAAKRYGIQALPTSVLVGPEGTILRAVQGLRSYLPAQIEYHLREVPSGG